MPKRIQLSRKKGWRKPEGAVVVARPGKWGNPISLEGHPFAGFVALEVVGPRGTRTQKEWRRAAVVALFRRWINEPEQASLVADLRELRGKDLCCWCRLDQPCHADVLLELANGDPA